MLAPGWIRKKSSISLSRHDNWFMNKRREMLLGTRMNKCREMLLGTRMNKRREMLLGTRTDLHKVWGLTRLVNKNLSDFSKSDVSRKNIMPA